jgi:tetratricopeptide (TPR) repeat protein
MRPGKLICAAVSAVLCTVLGLASPVRAQQSSSGSGQTPPAQDNSNTTPPSSDPKAKPPADDNAFPEDVSRKAAKEAEEQKKDDGQTPAPDPASQDTQPPAKSGTDDNAFPEDVSRKAAADAKSAGSSSGVSSSSDYNDRTNGGRGSVQPNVPMTHIHGKDPAKEDVYVGTFYLQSGDFQGAYARFKEASTLHPENADAMFGLAEAARHLKKDDEAMENYRLFLDVVPSGSKAKEARKALASLEKPH